MQPELQRHVQRLLGRCVLRIQQYEGLMKVLREASKALAQNGWTLLEDALSWVVDKHPEQTPSKYGCRSWPQVLSESRQFELQYRIENGRKVAWFRCRS